jgi:hypothetical protein
VNNLPFDFNYEAIPDKGKIDIYMDLECSVDESPYNLETLLSPLKVFANLANVGGFAGDKYQPSTSFMNLTDSCKVSKKRLSWSLNYRNVDAKSINVLKNILHYAHLKISSIQAISIKASQEMLNASYIDELPPLFLPLPFTFEDERGIDETNLTIEIYLLERQSKVTITQVEDVFGHWFTAASNGAFSSNVYPPDLCKIYIGDETVYTDDMLIIFIDKLIIDNESGLSCLLNALHWGHSHLASIKDVKYL